MLARTVLTDKGNSFQLTSIAIQLANVTQFVDSQVGTRTIDCASHNFIANIAHLLKSQQPVFIVPLVVFLSKIL